MSVAVLISSVYFVSMIVQLFARLFAVVLCGLAILCLAPCLRFSRGLGFLLVAVGLTLIFSILSEIETSCSVLSITWSCLLPSTAILLELPSAITSIFVNTAAEFVALGLGSALQAPAIALNAMRDAFEYNIAATPSYRSTAASHSAPSSRRSCCSLQDTERSAQPSSATIPHPPWLPPSDVQLNAADLRPHPPPQTPLPPPVASPRPLRPASRRRAPPPRRPPPGHCAWCVRTRRSPPRCGPASTPATACGARATCSRARCRARCAGPRSRACSASSSRESRRPPPSPAVPRRPPRRLAAAPSRPAVPATPSPLALNARRSAAAAAAAAPPRRHVTDGPPPPARATPLVKTLKCTEYIVLTSGLHNTSARSVARVNIDLRTVTDAPH
jgi:hypothetical protein